MPLPRIYFFMQRQLPNFSTESGTESFCAAIGPAFLFLPVLMQFKQAQNLDGVWLIH